MRCETCPQMTPYGVTFLCERLNHKIESGEAMRFHSERCDVINILITGDADLPPPYGGLARRIENNVNEWGKSNNKVYLLIPHKKETLFNAYHVYDVPPLKICTNSIIYSITHPLLSLKILSSCLNLYKLNSFSTKKLITSLHYAQKVHNLIKKHNISVIESHYAFESTYITQLVAENLNIPVVVMSYAEAIEWSGKKEGKHIDNISEKFSPLFKEVYIKAKKIIVPSKHCAKGPIKYVPENKIEIIYSGIVTIKLKQVEKRNRKIILFVGQLDERKGAKYLITSIKEISKQIDDFDVSFIGENIGDSKTKLVTIAIDNDILHHCYFHGKVSDEILTEQYNRADVLVFPSISEQECMGMSMKEALSCGTPVVAFNVGGVSEAIEDGVTGYLVEPKNTQQLAEKIIKILKEDGKAYMKDACMKKARDLFDIKNLAKKELEVLKCSVKKV